MLRRADEKTPASSARMAIRPRTAAIRYPTLRMTPLCFTTLMTTGFFQFSGHGNGELCLCDTNGRFFLIMDETKPDTIPVNRVESTPPEAVHLLEGDFLRIRTLLLLGRPQTQNA